MPVPKEPVGPTVPDPAWSYQAGHGPAIEASDGADVSITAVADSGSDDE